MDEEEIHDSSHHPRKYFGLPHFMPVSVGDGEAVLTLNALRAMVREVEILAYEAFKNESGPPDREDILKAVNRLSSALYVLMFKAKIIDAPGEEGEHCPGCEVKAGGGSCCYPATN
jgi:ethanolamine utilization cobalamin adenosyltransferase